MAVQSGWSAVRVAWFPQMASGFGFADIDSQISPAVNCSVVAPQNHLLRAKMEMIKIHIWTFVMLKVFRRNGKHWQFVMQQPRFTKRFFPLVIVTPMTASISLQVTGILRSKGPLAWNHLNLDYKSLLLCKKVQSNHCEITGLSGNSCFHFVLLPRLRRRLNQVNASFQRHVSRFDGRQSEPSTG